MKMKEKARSVADLSSLRVPHGEDKDSSTSSYTGFGKFYVLFILVFNLWAVDCFCWEYTNSFWMSFVRE